MKVNIFGLGYIGLPTAALIASKKIHVLGIDVKQAVVDTVNRGEIHIIEPDLVGLVRFVVREKYLQASVTPDTADVHLIAVPTPVGENHSPDLSYVESATRNIIPYLKEGDLFIIESTSPVGTTEKMREIIHAERPELTDKIYMAYCPERVLPGKVIYELEHNERAIGGVNPESTRKAIDFYKNFVKGELNPTNARTAEMVKLVENASRDVQIAFANELSIISDKAGIDVWELIALANKHPRVNILRPGTGVGGHCIAVDPWFIVSAFETEAKIIRTAREINNYKTEWVIEKIKSTALEFELKHKRKPLLAAMGLSFKPDIDDLRESPALYVALSLQQQGYHLIAVEPNLEKGMDDFEMRTAEEALHKADIILFLVAHKEFKGISVSQDKCILDFVHTGFQRNG